MKKINIKIRNPLMKTTGKAEFVMEIEDNDSILIILKKLNYSDRHIPTILSIVNTKNYPHSHIPNNNDEIEFFILMGGG